MGASQSDPDAIMSAPLVEKDGKSMIGILSLGIAKDKPFTLVLDGNDEEAYMSKFEDLIENE